MREEKRQEYQLSNDEIVILAGGKIDQNKTQVLTLMQSVNQMKNEKIKLLVFGSVSAELKEEFDKQLSESVKYIGWKQSREIYSEFAGADIIAFPGLHSVLWEQAVGMGKPCVFKKIEGFTHVDIEGNCMYFEEESVQSYRQTLDIVCSKLSQMEMIAKQKGIKRFSYENIAKKSLEVK